MRESDRNLDSTSSTDATHLKPVRPPAKQASGEVPAVTPSAAQSSPQSSRSPEFLANPAYGHSTVPESLILETDPETSSEFRDRVLNWLRKNVPNSRLQHILRVEQMSAELAQRHQVNVAQAALSGLLHDLAKFFKPQRLLQMAQAEGLLIDPVECANPHLLHAAVGAIVVREEFGVHDEAVLDAIRDHTLGSPGMSALSCVVFLADSLEPGRGDTPALAALRYSSQHNLYRAVWQTCDESLHYLIARSQQIHPRMVLTRNWALALTDRQSLDQQADKPPPASRATEV